MRRDQLPPHKTATYVLPRWKVVYVSVPKAACTSVKWLLAGLQGEDPEQFYTSLAREVARSTTIHRRRLWRHTPMLHGLPGNDLAAVSPDQGWFVFAVVRHPSTRVWSAWQSKFLLQEPRWGERFGAEPWFPRIPVSTQDVVEDFQQFVRSIAEKPDQLVLRDRHFQPQSRLITPERTPYNRIYKTSEIPELLEDLATHLHSQGWRGSLDLVPSNETPLRPLASMFSPTIAAAISQVYQEDFDRFGYEFVEPDKLEGGDEYAESTLREIGRLVERDERIGDLAMRAQRLQKASKSDRQELRELRRRVARLTSDAALAARPVSKVRRIKRLRRRVARITTTARGRYGKVRLTISQTLARGS